MTILTCTAPRTNQEMQAILVSRLKTVVQEKIMSLMTSSADYLPNPARENFPEGFHNMRVPGAVEVIYCNRVLKPLRLTGTS